MNLIVFALKEEDQIINFPGWMKIYTGIGKINASFNLTKAILKHKPNKIINFGTAGGISLKKHSFVKVKKFIQLDMNCYSLLNKKYITPFEEDEGYIGEDGICCGSSDTFITDKTNFENLIDLADMESYALAKICKIENIHFESYKYITDECNNHSTDDWFKNIKKAKEYYEAIMRKE